MDVVSDVLLSRIRRLDVSFGVLITRSSVGYAGFGVLISRTIWVGVVSDVFITRDSEVDVDLVFWSVETVKWM